MDELTALGEMIRSADVIGRGKKRVHNIITAFDIESTNIAELEQSVMYIWQFAYDDHVIIGRTWDEFKTLVNLINANARARVIVFVHNLSYEFSFLKGVLPFKTDDVFIVDGRKVLYARYDKIEFRCSFLQSNRSLESLLDFYKVQHKKLILDYSVERFADTPLSEDELNYCKNDVLGLVEALRLRMREYADDLSTIPYTSTGYARRECKPILKDAGLNRLHGDYNVYTLLRACFRGGNTHANRHYTAAVIDNVLSVDRSSSYPDVLVNCPYPMTKWKSVIDLSMSAILRAVNHGYAVIGRYRIYDVKLRNDSWGCPYIPKYKCLSPAFTKSPTGTAVIDNGRIISVEDTYIDICLTDIDLKIINDEYEYSGIEVIEAYISKYAMLPQSFRDLVNLYYTFKTELKGSDDPKDIETYNKAKALLNALYGMFAQDPAKIGVEYINDGRLFQLKHELIDENGLRNYEAIRTEYQKFISKSVMPYQIGVYCTAWARLRLEEGIRLCGDNFIYTDTDSIKYIYDPDISFESYNRDRINASTINGAYAVDRKGNTHYMGVFEVETKKPITFKTLGAKKYLYEDDDGLHLTLAGVSKKWGALELQLNGGFPVFSEDFIFRHLFRR